MADTILTTVIGAAIPTGLSLLVIILTRERNRGKDHGALSSATNDIAALKKSNVEMQATLATHTTILESLEKDIEKHDGRIARLQREQDRALGREEGRKHNT